MPARRSNRRDRGSASQRAPQATRQTAEKAYSDDGVDLTLIRWMLSMTPAERLETLERTLRSLARVRAGKTQT